MTDPTSHRQHRLRGRPRLPALRRRQPLLRGARRLHPPPRPRARDPGVRVGRRSGRRTYPVLGGKVFRGRQERDLRPGRHPRRARRLLPRQPQRRRPARAAQPARAASAPSTATATPASPRMDDHGLDKVWLFPTLGMIYEEPLQHDPEAVMLAVHRVQPVARGGLGLRLPGPHLRRALHHARRRRLGLRRARVGPRPRAPAPSSCARPRRPPSTGPCSPGDPAFDPFWARVDEAGITVVVHAGDSGYTVPRLRQRRLHHRLRRRAAAHPDAPARAPDRGLPVVADLRQPLPPLPEPAGRLGRERLGVPARPVRPAAGHRPARWTAGSPRTRSRRSGATSGSTRSGRTTSTTSSSAVGVDRVIFGSDWPHIEALPHPLDYVPEVLHLPAASQKLILADNVAALNQLQPA